MKNMLLFLCLGLIFFAFNANAEEEDGKFFEDVLISDDIKLKESSETAKDKASRLLDSKPNAIKIEGQPLSFRSRQAKPEAIDTTTKYGEAPFGLSWGATYNQAKALGVSMEKIELKDYVNSFEVKKLPKPLSDFDRVIVSFGEDNSLWRILAYSKKFDDDADAAKVMYIYRRYYKLLSQKYGNAQQFFTPKITTVEKQIKDDNGRDKIEITTTEEPIGGPNFLQELQSGQAVLYATFEDSDVGAALALSVDGDGKSFIIIDYTNLKIFKEREDKALNAL